MPGIAYCNRIQSTHNVIEFPILWTLIIDSPQYHQHLLWITCQYHSTLLSQMLRPTSAPLVHCSTLRKWSDVVSTTNYSCNRQIVKCRDFLIDKSRADGATASAVYLNNRRYPAYESYIKRTHYRSCRFFGGGWRWNQNGTCAIAELRQRYYLNAVNMTKSAVSHQLKLLLGTTREPCKNAGRKNMFYSWMITRCGYYRHCIYSYRAWAHATTVPVPAATKQRWDIKGILHILRTRNQNVIIS